MVSCDIYIYTGNIARHTYNKTFIGYVGVEMGGASHESNGKESLSIGQYVQSFYT